VFLEHLDEILAVQARFRDHVKPLE